MTDSKCDPGKFGLECEKTCNCATDEACFVATGGCPSGCKAGYYGEACQKACGPHTWGISCNQNCKDRCIDNTCNRFNGDCDKGCKDAHQPPACTLACHETYYGSNCSQKCSPNCTNSLCHPVNGHCLYCDDGSEGDFCDQPCDPYHYGILCKLNCSINCFQSKCDSVSGQCEQCCPGLTGKFCQSEKEQSDGTSIGIGIGVAIGVVVTSLLFIIAAVLLHRMRILSLGRNQKIKKEKPENIPGIKLESEQHKIYTEAIETEEIDLQVSSSPYTNQNVHTYDVINLQDVEKSDYHKLNI
ncbi:multiple epidermal growth factor-like domains protein 10 [Physella acuta]|uniref:multiple epidermal growth factor-like domains protein 10 n=1 Tax=Physella acuta TaxID=109671 RepID=UPI0027DB9597|nr:multiple epidermal growth factor-like domains protein 10 [Physella acuta]